MTMARAEGVTPPHQAQKLCVSQNERQTAEISIPATLRGSIRGTGRAQRARLGVSFQITGRKSYGHVGSLEEGRPPSALNILRSKGRAGENPFENSRNATFSGV
jgi:hypothetical protein